MVPAAGAVVGRGVALTVGVAFGTVATGVKGGAVPASVGTSVGWAPASTVGVAVRGMRVGVAVGANPSIPGTDGPTRTTANVSTPTSTTSKRTASAPSAGSGKPWRGLGNCDT